LKKKIESRKESNLNDFYMTLVIPQTSWTIIKLERKNNAKNYSTNIYCNSFVLRNFSSVDCCLFQL